ncbi:MAG TPA: LytTR family transcriptional regulator, partial [Bacteroidetes bacterium]|nr:LytTR family transcriptional regulator [Bacteroidota bacterium]
RVHRSHIVNLHCIRSYQPQNGGQIELKNGEVIPVSRRKKKELLSHLREAR